MTPTTQPNNSSDIIKNDSKTWQWLYQLKHKGAINIRFSFPALVGWFVFCYICVSLLVWLVWPSVWWMSLRSSWWMWFIVVLFNCMLPALFEWLFHGQILHKATKPFENWKKDHTEHHLLTQIKLTKENSRLKVDSDYPLNEIEKMEGATFPWWAQFGFCLFGSIFLIPAQLIFTKIPILLPGLLSVSINYFLYEAIHAVHHLPESWWMDICKVSTNAEGIPVAEKNIGPLTYALRRLHNFHSWHHCKFGINRSVGGFFLLPVWDWIFGTYVSTKTLFFNGAQISDYEMPRRFKPKSNT